MANQEHVAVFKEEAKSWNEWRKNNPSIQPDLSGANLKAPWPDAFRGMNLDRTNLSEADLSQLSLDDSTLKDANLVGARLFGTRLNRATLVQANLASAWLRSAELCRADLSGAELGVADLTGADLRGANLAGTFLIATVFADNDLTDARGLDACVHQGPCTIDFRTLAKTGKLPTTFLRGCGLTDWEIEVATLFQPNLTNAQITDIAYRLVDVRTDQPIQFYSCFTSYSSKDQDFAKRLHADLQNKGVRCWFSPEDLKIGDRTRPAIDEAIRIRDKLLLILSENSITSDWVEKEVETAFEEESRRKETVLFPIRLDDTVMQTNEAWAADIRRTRNIGDFTHWKDHDAYHKGLERLIRDLRCEAENGASA